MSRACLRVNSPAGVAHVYTGLDAAHTPEVWQPLFGIEDALLNFARDVYDAISWPGVVFLMAIESACVPFPSEIIMPLAGWILVKEKSHGEEYLLLAAFFGACGNTLGSVIAYYAGAWGGRPFVQKYGRYVLLTPRELDWADRWFNRHGEITVFATRLMPVVRTFISVPAGIARMSFWRFTALTFAGSFPWSLGLAWGGYLLGENYDKLSAYFRPVSIPIALTILAAAAFLLFRRIRELRHAGSYEGLLEEQREEAARHPETGAVLPRPE